MIVLKTALRIIALIVIMVIVGYVLFFVNDTDRTPGQIAPITDGTNATSTTGGAVEVPVVVQTIKEQASSSPQVTRVVLGYFA